MVAPDRSRLLKRLCLAVLLVILLAACAPVKPPAAAPEATAKIKVGVQPFIGYAPFFIAQDAGYFARHGIEAELIESKSSDEIVTQLMQGDLDMANFAITPGFFNGVAKGGTAKAVLGGSRWDPNQCAPSGLVALPQQAAQLKDPANWKGIKIGTDPVGLQSMYGLFVAGVLKQQGLTLADIETVRLPPAATIDALESGAINVAQVNEPWLTRVKDKTGAILVVGTPEIAPNGQLTMIGFSPRLLQDSELGKRAAAAFLEAVKQYGEGSANAQNVEIFAKYTKLEPALVKQICWPAMPLDGIANLDSVAAFQAWAVAQGLQDRVLEQSEYWDGRFVGE
ncbi:MAG: ABC transporter substrate-binding protein [Anaerolineales bacterium]|nr:ABC transporter substrate-binding protein [Anaerolineales bacterium]